MAKWGAFDFEILKTTAARFDNAEEILHQFMHDFILEMAYRAEAKIKMLTPVDSGELRRNWTVGKVERNGNGFIVEISNNTEYAPYVEYGHRTGDDLTKWVEGRFMMTISMKEIEQELPAYLERRQAELLKRLLEG